jgi:hypothetical protein
MQKGRSFLPEATTMISNIKSAGSRLFETVGKSGSAARVLVIAIGMLVLGALLFWIFNHAAALKAERGGRSEPPSAAGERFTAASIKVSHCIIYSQLVNHTGYALNFRLLCL